jgi:hypothetical protein
MTEINALFAFVGGLFLRFGLPVLITVLAVYFLRKLDERWQKESESRLLPVEKPECWKTNRCAEEVRENCPGFLSPLPCWQARRLPNGYLRQECFTCPIFRGAPIPAHP